MWCGMIKVHNMYCIYTCAPHWAFVLQLMKMYNELSREAEQLKKKLQETEDKLAAEVSTLTQSLNPLEHIDIN